jgi:vacuolar iron transporter family protein
MDTSEKIRRGIEKHKGNNTLREVILGGQDGLVNVLGITLGISASTGDMKILLAAGLAATFAESVSMGAVAYTSFITDRDHYLKEMEREKYEIENFPDTEREEIRSLYFSKGFRGKILDDVVTQICSDKQVWLDVMMAEELRLEPVDTKEVLRISVIVTLASIAGSLIPLAPFFWMPAASALPVSIIASGVTLFAVGAYQAKTYVGDWRVNGLKMVAIGMGAAAIGFIVARIFHTG